MVNTIPFGAGQTSRTPAANVIDASQIDGAIQEGGDAVKPAEVCNLVQTVLGVRDTGKVHADGTPIIIVDAEIDWGTGNGPDPVSYFAPGRRIPAVWTSALQTNPGAKLTGILAKDVEIDGRVYRGYQWLPSASQISLRPNGQVIANLPK